MKNDSRHDLPLMLYADNEGHIYEHPDYRMVGFSGREPSFIEWEDLVELPEFSKLFYLPACPPMGLDPETGRVETVPYVQMDDERVPCFAVAAFLEPGFVRSHLPAADYHLKSFVLPSWAYGAVGYQDGRYWAAGFQVEYSERWDPRNYDDDELVPAIDHFLSKHRKGPLVNHLIGCATQNHCFAAKNLFLGRWEAPLPVSRACNAACLGCLSLQPGDSCDASHDRIDFTPSREEIVELAVMHLSECPRAIVSFGQGCEGEPLMEYGLISESVADIRRRTGKGTINLNTNGSFPDRIRKIADSGLDSIRISMNSVRPDVYEAYYRPKNYDFKAVKTSVALSVRLGLYTMVNYLVFPGVSDQVEELDALMSFISKTELDFLHLKNLCIDPPLYMEKMPVSDEKGLGMRAMALQIRKKFPNVELGYFNQPVR